MDSHNVKAWLLLSEVVDALEDQIIALENALYVDPENTHARLRLEYKRTQNQIQQVLEAKEKGQTKIARDILRKLVNAGKADEQVWMLLSDLSTSLKNEKVALKQALKFDPNHAEAKARLEKLEVKPKELLHQAALYEHRKEMQKAIDTYIWVSMETDSPTVRNEADRRLENLQAQLEMKDFRQISPKMTLLRLMVGPIFLYTLLMLLQGGFKLSEIHFFFWIGWLYVVLGTFLIVLTSTLSTRYLLHSLWQAIDDRQSTPRKKLMMLGLLLYLVPHGFLVFDSIKRLKQFIFSVGG